VTRRRKTFLAAMAISMVFSACEKPSFNVPTNENSETVKTGLIEIEDFIIGGISFGTSVEDVKSKLGLPVSIAAVYHTCVSDEVCQDWHYKDVWFSMYNEQVDGMSSKSSGLCLYDKICPNDDLKRVFEHLGETKIWPASTDKPPRLAYHSKKHEACWLWVFLNSEKNTVTELRLACQP